MSRQVEERVVEMRFDNGQFERNVQTSMSTIDKLKQKLNFTGATKGLEAVSATAKKVDMSGLAKSVDTVSLRFSALQVAGVTALANITTAAMQAGSNMVKALTLDPVISGFQEYELKMNSIQTILANTQSKGTTLEDVTAALDELNTYADQTIYNFGEMTRNIGTFTAAGVDLETSVASIKGLANLAAASGSSSYQAATAMYQLSQAIAAGKVQLMDWNSVVNAGMGGELFQNALKRTAEHFGTNVDGMIKKYGSFRESLTEGGWLTAEVLTETLKQISGAYTEAELIAQGYTEQQAKDITQLAATATEAATKVKTFTQLFDTMKEAVGSGWATTWEIVIGDIDEAKDSLTEISELFGEFIQKGADSRNQYLEEGLSSSWKRLSKEIRATGIDMNDFEAKLVEVGKKHGVVTDEMIEKAGGLEQSMKSGWASGEIFAETLRSFAGGLKGVSQSTEDMTAKLEYFQKVVNEVWHGDFKNGAERVEALTKAGYDYATVQDLVNKTVDGHKLTLADLNVEQAANLGFTKEQIQVLGQLADEAEKAGTPINELIENLTRPSGRELLLGSLKNTFEALLTVLDAVRTAWGNVFMDNPEGLYNAAEALHEFTSWLIMSDDMAEDLRWTLQGLFSILDLVMSVLGGGLKIAVMALGEVFGIANASVLTFTGGIGQAISAFHDWVEENGVISASLEAIASVLAMVIKGIGNFVTAVYELPAVQNGIAKVADTFVKIGQAIKNYFTGGILEDFSELIDVINSMDGHLTLDGWYRAVEAFRNGIINMFDGVKEFFSSAPGDIIDGFVNGIQSGIGRVREIIAQVAEVVINTVKILLGIHSPSTEFMEIGQNVIEGLVNGIQSGISTVLDLLSDLGNRMVDILAGIDWGKVLAVAGTVGLVYFAKRILDIFDAIVAPLEGVGSVLEGVGSILEGVGEQVGKVVKGFAKVLNAKAFEIYAGGIRSIALSILLMVVSVKLLAKTNAKDLWKAVGVIAGLAAVMAALAGLVVLVSAMSSRFGIAAVGVGKIIAGVVALAAVLRILASVANLMAKLDATGLAKGLGGMLTLMGSLIAVIAVFGKIDSKNAKNIDKLGTMLLKMSVSLALISVVIKLISGMSAGELVKGAAALTAFVGFVSLLALINTKLKSKGMDTLGSGLLKISAALIIMIAVVKLINGLSAGEIAKGLAGLVAFSGVIALLTLISTKLGGPQVAKLGGSLLAMSSAMLILTAVVKLLGGMDVGAIVKGEAALLGLTAIVAILVGIVKSMERDAPKMAGTLLALSVSVGILGGIAALLSLIDLPGLIKGLAAVGILSSFVMAMTYVTKYANDVKGNFIGIAIAVGVLAASVAVLSFIDPAKLASATAAITVLIGMLSVLMYAASGLNRRRTATATSALITIAAMLGVVSTIVYLLAQLPIANVLTAAGSLSVLLTSLSVSIKLISTVGPIAPTALVAIGIMGAIMAALAIVLKVINDMDIGNSLGTVVSLSTLIIALSAATTLLSVAGRAGPAALIGVASLAALIAGVGGLMVGIGALAIHYPQMEEFLNKGLVLLEQIGTGIGSFFGNIVGGFIEGISSGLPGVAQNLSSFMTNLQPFLQGANSIQPEAMEGVKYLASAILTLTKADLLNSITSWITGGDSMTEFAQQLVPFGQAMLAFSNTIAGIDAETVKNTAIAGQTLAEMAATIPNTGGLIAKFTGENSMTAFAQQLVPFGNAMKSYSVAVAGMDVNAVVNSATAGQALTELAKTIPNTGGLVAFFTGENSMTEFAQQLVPFGDAMKSYALAVAGMDVNAVVNSTTAGQALVELAKTIPNTGGLIAFFTGENSMAAFGEQLISFGTNFRAYADEMSGVNPEVVTSTAAAAQSLVELQNALPNNGLFTNETWLDEFGSMLADFGEDFADYYGSISAIDPSRVKSVTAEVKDLARLLSDITNLDTGGVSNFAKALKELGNAGVDEFVNAFEGSTGRVTKAASGMFDAFVSAAKSSATKISNAVTDVMDKAVKAVENKKNAFESAAKTLMNSLSNGVEKNIKPVVTAVKNAMDDAVEAVRSKKNAFYSVGADIGQGLTNGIKSKTASAVAAARSMAQQVENAARAQLKTHSPSEVFEEIGEDVDEGLALGVTSSISVVNDGVTKMSSTMIKVAKEKLEIKEDGGSQVAKRQIGEPVMIGIAEGIEEDMSAEEAMAQKAQNIVDAFQTEIDKYEPENTMFDLEYQLWEKTEGVNASPIEKANRQLISLQNELQNQKEIVAYSNAEYQATLESFGRASEYTQEAYQKLLQQEITLADLVQEINDLRTSAMDEQWSAFEEYQTWLDENQEAYEKMGKTLDEIKAIAAEETGYHANHYMDTTQLDPAEVLREALNTLEVTYEIESKRTSATIQTASKQMGTDATTAMSDGIEAGTSKVTSSANTMVNDSLAEVKQSEPQWRAAGAYVVEGFVAGMRSKITEAAQAAAEIAMAAYRAAMAALNAASPSRLFMKVGSYVGEGFAIGISSTGREVKETSESMAQTAVNTVKSSINRLLELITSDLDTEPTIKPVLDLSEIQKGAGQINALFSRRQAASIGGQISANVSEKANLQNGFNNQNGGATYNFTQNNYSPKSLSRTDIYRQTKNQFSAFERMAKV